MKTLYNAPEAEILEIKLVGDICGPSQGDFADVPDDFDGSADGDEI